MKFNLKPFVLSEPTCLSLSGGRTSMFMLWLTLQANAREVIERDLRICFANTGKEHEATLRFVHRAAREWDVKIDWVEFVARSGPILHRLVDFDTASRRGEPFERLAEDKSHLPNPVMRFCTEELKVVPIRNHTGLAEEDTMVGVRADEPHRIHKMRVRGLQIPLVDADITKAHVRAFWREQPFDLELEERGGVTPWGNCDLCFLKGPNQIQSLIASEPPRAVWWATMEERRKATFRSDRPSYAKMLAFAINQDDMFAPLPERMGAIVPVDGTDPVPALPAPITTRALTLPGDLPPEVLEQSGPGCFCGD